MAKYREKEGVMKLSMQAKVGMVALTACLLLIGIIIWKGDIFLVAKGYEVIGSFTNAGGLMPGAEVRYRGYKVGKVMKIDPSPNEVSVYLMIEPNIKVPEGSTLRVAFDGLIGQKYVEIMPSLSNVPIKKGSRVMGFSTSGIVDFIDVGTQNLEESKQILQSIRKFTDDPAIQSAAKQILVNFEKSSIEINRITTNLNKSLGKGGFEETLNNLNSASNTINNVIKKMDGIINALDDLVSDPNFTTDIKATARNAKEAFEEFKKASTDASKALKKYTK
jgi:phospholipid/cholesterol/gamma-HCH transport system substrate-binding protein